MLLCYSSSNRRRELNSLNSWLTHFLSRFVVFSWRHIFFYTQFTTPLFISAANGTFCFSLNPGTSVTCYCGLRGDRASLLPQEGSNKDVKFELGNLKQAEIGEPLDNSKRTREAVNWYTGAWVSGACLRKDGGREQGELRTKFKNTGENREVWTTSFIKLSTVNCRLAKAYFLICRVSSKYDFLLCNAGHFGWALINLLQFEWKEQR